MPYAWEEQARSKLESRLAEAGLPLDRRQRTTTHRSLAADRQLEAVQAAFDAETVTLDQLLEAQRRRAEAHTGYFRTLLDYQRAIIAVHLRKGSLL